VSGREGERVDANLEPLLGPRQTELVMALTFRLAHGLPLSEADTFVASWLVQVLRLGPDIST